MRDAMKILTAALPLAAAAACTEHRSHGIEGTQSIEVTLVDPPSGGSIDNRLREDQRTITFNLAAKDADNQFDPTFTRDVRVYAQFLGTVTPELNAAPLLQVTMTDGAAQNVVVTLPEDVLGPTTLWIDDGSGLFTDYVPGRVSGSSPTLWYRDPIIRDLQTPKSETSLDALELTPLTNKQVTVLASRHGAQGRLVITSVFAQGYTVSDVRCADTAGTPPCTAEAYDHAMVFTFSAGRGSDGHVLEDGEAIDGFAGAVTEFNGLTELSFPRTFTPIVTDTNGDGRNDAVVAARKPAPVLFDPAWFGPLSNPLGRINFERNEAGAIEIRNATVCPLDEDYTTFKQWKLDPAGGAGCTGGNVLNLITSGVVTSINPATLVGKTLPRVVGIVRPVNIGSFNVWIVYPRSLSDFTLPTP